MISKIALALLSSFFGILILFAVMCFRGEIFNLTDSFLMLFVYYTPLLAILIFATIGLIHIINTSSQISSFLKTGTGFFLTALCITLVFAFLNEPSMNDYDFKVMFLIAYLSSMLIYFQIIKILKKHVNN